MPLEVTNIPNYQPFSGTHDNTAGTRAPLVRWRRFEVGMHASDRL